MTREEVLEALGNYLRVEYGKLLTMRGARRERRAAGGTWEVTVVIAAKGGDIPVVDLEIADDGTVVNPPSVDDVVEAVRRHFATSSTNTDPLADPASDMADLMGFGGEEEEAPPSSLNVDAESLYARAQALIAAGDEPSLQKARVLMPRLLTEPERRRAVLVWMAVIERKLGQIPLALEYLEAAAREFADRFDLVTLEKLAALALELMGKDDFASSPVKRLLDQSRERMRPIASMFDCPQFFAVSEDERDFLGDHLTLRTLGPSDVLVREGEPSRKVFVLKSGLIGVHLEQPEGGSRLVRCCFPGWLLGESSVLVDDDPRCTATLRAERVSEVWSIDAKVLREVMNENPDLRHRIAATKSLHVIDSFFSMHETLSQLDASVRDEMLGCIQKIEVFDKDGPVILAGHVPTIAALITVGEVAIYEGEWSPDVVKDTVAVLPADRFVGVRDALHAIAPTTTAVARAGTTLALLNADLLRALAEKSPESVVAVLERLG